MAERRKSISDLGGQVYRILNSYPEEQWTQERRERIRNAGRRYVTRMRRIAGYDKDQALYHLNVGIVNEYRRRQDPAPDDLIKATDKKIPVSQYTGRGGGEKGSSSG